MAGNLKIFGLLIYKNLIVRKRHWRQTIFLQAFVPIALFALLQAMRDFSVQPPHRYNESIHHAIQTKENLVLDKIDNDITQIYYVPRNAYTDKIMEEARKCLRLHSESKHITYTESLI